VSHTPRIGSRGASGVGVTGGFATGGSGVTSDLGGVPAQPASSSASAPVRSSAVR